MSLADATSLTPNPGDPTQERLALKFKQAFEAVGALDQAPDFLLSQLCQGLAAAVRDELINHAELSIEVDPGPPPTATGVIT